MELKKVFVYCRKSSEQEDRQILSLDSQEKELMKVVNDNNLKVIATYKESGSAHIIGRRMFNEMLTRIENGEAQGIVVWDESRIARNSLDGGKVIYMMDLKQIECIYKPGKIYKNTPDDKSWMSMVFMMSKKESDDKGVNAKRGMTTKASMGWFPGTAPLGYKNTFGKKGTNTIEVDEEKFNFIKRIFGEIIKGRQASEVWKDVFENWGLKISKANFYYMLGKTFYYGEYEWPKGSGNWYQGLHKPMITKEEFDVVQKALGKYGRPVARTHNFDLTGLFRCQECGCAMTATQKIKHYKKTGRIAVYTYYHCSKKNKKIKCKSKPVTENDILNQINTLLKKLGPNQKFVDWMNKWLSVVHKNESAFNEETLKLRQAELSNLEKRLDKLLDMKLDETIDDQAYREKKESLEKEKNEIKAKIDSAGNELNDWRTKVENTIDFARNCQYKFENGLREEKQTILLTIGTNLILKTNKMLDIKLKPAYEILSNQENWGEKYKDWQEPQKYTEIMAKNSDLRPANPVWLPRVDSNHGPIAYKTP